MKELFKFDNNYKCSLNGWPYAMNSLRLFCFLMTRTLKYLSKSNFWNYKNLCKLRKHKPIKLIQNKLAKTK